MALDLHAAQIQGFFDIPVDHLFSAPVMVEYFETRRTGDLTIVSPDAGGVERARAFAKRLNAPLAIIDKRRTEVNVAEVMNIIGEVRGKHCLIVDDLVDTAGTLVKGVEALLEQGAAGVSACATHAGFVGSGGGADRAVADLSELVVTNSIPLSRRRRRCGKIRHAVGGAVAGAGDPVDPRGWLGEHVVYSRFCCARLEIKPGSAARNVAAGWRPGDEEGNEKRYYNRGGAAGFARQE